MIYTIIVIPYRVAFSVTDTAAWAAADLCIDCLFMLDVVINMFTAYYFSQDELIITHKKILLHYAKTWMLLDVLASIPFQYLFTNTNWKSLIRFSKLPRLYRLVKLAKIIKFLKTNNFGTTFSCTLRIPVAVKRLLYFLSIFFLMCHLISCLWYFTSTLEPGLPYNWVTKYGIQDYGEGEMYIASLYWTVATLSTVGYGDITPANTIEMCVCIIVMLGGVFFYSYTIGTITSIMAELDRKKFKLENKLLILQDIDQNYSIGKRLFKRIRSALEYDQTHQNKVRNEMIALLPKKLALQLNLLMNKQIVEKNNKFFENQPIQFINLTLSCLRPLRLKCKDHVYYKSDYSVEMYFVTSGELFYYDTYNSFPISFEKIPEGDYFGDAGVLLSEPYEFSVRTERDSELMALTRDDLFNKILTVFDEQLRCDLIVKTRKRREELRIKRDAAVLEYIHTRNLVKSLVGENHKRIDSGEATFLSINSNKNARKIREIRNTLSPRTITMLDFTNINDLEKMKRDIEGLKLVVERFQDRIKHDKILK